MPKWVRRRPGLKWHRVLTFTRMIGGLRSLDDRNFNRNSEGYAERDDDPPAEDQCKICVRTKRTTI